MFKTPNDRYRPALEKLFERLRIAELSDLRSALAVSSRTTVFSALKAVGYYTSYSHAGRFYTLARIPSFDARGLWSYGHVRFSKHGTLRATVVALVREAPDGRTHQELRDVLGLRIHDTLRGVVDDGVLGRARLESVYVYTDSDARRAAAQLQARHLSSAPTPHPTAALRSRPPLDATYVVDILLAVIDRPKDDATAIARRLRAEGLALTDEQVQEVFACYGLEKKTARFRSRSSRRSGPGSIG